MNERKVVEDRANDRRKEGKLRKVKRKRRRRRKNRKTRVRKEKKTGRGWERM